MILNRRTYICNPQGTNLTVRVNAHYKHRQSKRAEPHTHPRTHAHIHAHTHTVNECVASHNSPVRRAHTRTRKQTYTCIHDVHAHTSSAACAPRNSHSMLMRPDISRTAGRYNQTTPRVYFSVYFNCTYCCRRARSQPPPTSPPSTRAPRRPDHEQPPHTVHATHGSSITHANSTRSCRIARTRHATRTACLP